MSESDQTCADEQTRPLGHLIRTPYLTPVRPFILSLSHSVRPNQALSLVRPAEPAKHSAAASVSFSALSAVSLLFHAPEHSTKGIAAGPR